MRTLRFFEKIPAHLACAVTTLCLVALGSGACDRTAEGRGDAKAPSSAQATSDDEGEPAQSPSEHGAKAAPGAQAPAAAASEAAPPATRRYVIAALGDSLTDKRSRGGGYLDVVAARCPESVIDNYGKGGDMTNQMRRRFESDVLPVARERGYTHLIVFGGVNDLYSDLTAGRTNDRIQRDLGAIYAGAREHGMAVVALTVAPWGGFSRYFDARRSANTLGLNQWISAQAGANVVERVVDAYSLLSCGDPERLCPEYAPPFEDGLHPGEKGHEVLGKALFETAFADCR